jgi:hypothetical protein
MTTQYVEPIELTYDSSIDPKTGCAKKPYSAALQFRDLNPLNPLGGIFEILAHGPDDQCPAGYHDHICIYVPNAKAKNGRDHVFTIEAATAKNNWQPRISIGGGYAGAQVDFLGSSVYRKIGGVYYRSVLTASKDGSTATETWVKSPSPLLPY